MTEHPKERLVRVEKSVALHHRDAALDVVEHTQAIAVLNGHSDRPGRRRLAGGALDVDFRPTHDGRLPSRMRSAACPGRRLPAAKCKRVVTFRHSLSSSRGVLKPDRMLQSVLSEETANPDPLAQFRLWFEDAKGAAVPEPNAMAVASVGPSGAPSLRMVLLKGHGDDGFVFYTNYGSRKAQELEHNRRVALLFFWATLQRQIRIEGLAARTSREESADYFRTRSRDSQIGAWASAQSEVITTRAALEQRVVEL